MFSDKHTINPSQQPTCQHAGAWPRSAALIGSAKSTLQCADYWQQIACRFVPPVEVRQYDPYLIAEVTFKKGEAQDMKAALSGGFRAIAGYIFDSNVGSRQLYRP